MRVSSANPPHDRFFLLHDESELFKKLSSLFDESSLERNRQYPIILKFNNHYKNHNWAKEVELELIKIARRGRKGQRVALQAVAAIVKQNRAMAQEMFQIRSLVVEQILANDEILEEEITACCFAFAHNSFGLQFEEIFSHRLNSIIFQGQTCSMSPKMRLGFHFLSFLKPYFMLQTKKTLQADSALLAKVLSAVKSLIKKGDRLSEGQLTLWLEVVAVISQLIKHHKTDLKEWEKSIVSCLVHNIKYAYNQSINPILTTLHRSLIEMAKCFQLHRYAELFQFIQLGHSFYYQTGFLLLEEFMKTIKIDVKMNLGNWDHQEDLEGLMKQNITSLVLEIARCGQFGGKAGILFAQINQIYPQINSVEINKILLEQRHLTEGSKFLLFCLTYILVSGRLPPSSIRFPTYHQLQVVTFLERVEISLSVSIEQVRENNEIFCCFVSGLAILIDWKPWLFNDEMLRVLGLKLWKFGIAGVANFEIDRVLNFIIQRKDFHHIDLLIDLLLELNSNERLPLILSNNNSKWLFKIIKKLLIKCAGYLQKREHFYSYFMVFKLTISFFKKILIDGLNTSQISEEFQKLLIRLINCLKPIQNENSSQITNITQRIIEMLQEWASIITKDNGFPEIVPIYCRVMFHWGKHSDEIRKSICKQNKQIRNTFKNREEFEELMLEFDLWEIMMQGNLYHFNPQMFQEAQQAFFAFLPSSNFARLTTLSMYLDYCSSLFRKQTTTHSHQPQYNEYILKRLYQCLQMLLKIKQEQNFIKSIYDFQFEKLKNCIMREARRWISAFGSGSIEYLNEREELFEAFWDMLNPKLVDNQDKAILQQISQTQTHLMAILAQMLTSAPIQFYPVGILDGSHFRQITEIMMDLNASFEKLCGRPWHMEKDNQCILMKFMKYNCNLRRYANQRNERLVEI